MTDAEKVTEGKPPKTTLNERISAVKTLTDGIYRKLLGILLIVGGGAFLWKAAFSETGDSRFLGEIIGFIMGTAITTVISFWFHTSESSREKSKQIEKIANGGSNE